MRGYGEDDIANLREYYESLMPVPVAVNQKMMQMLREVPRGRRYACGGGRLCAGRATSPLLSTSKAGWLASYLDDVARYAQAPERVRARACFESLPRQLAKENTKFQYSVVENRGTARKFGSSVDWLVGAGMVRRWPVGERRPIPSCRL